MSLRYSKDRTLVSKILSVTVYIAPISWGLGDLIVSLPVIEGLIQTGEPTWLITRSSLQEGLSERIPGLAGTVNESEFLSKKLAPTERFVNLRDHPIQKNYWWGSPDFDQVFGEAKINDLLGKICYDMGIPVRFDRLKPLPFKNRPEAQEKIIFLPGSDGSYKEWPCEHWLTLASLLRMRNYEVLVLGQPQSSNLVQSVIKRGLYWLETPHLSDALDLISSSLAVIAVDTGLMHLAVHQNIPTIAIYRYRPVYLRPYQHCYPVIAEPCHPRCIEAVGAGGRSQEMNFLNFSPTVWNCFADSKERCLNKVYPNIVMDNFRQMEQKYFRGLANSTVVGF